MAFNSMFGKNILAAAVRASEIFEDDDEEISIVDLISPVTEVEKLTTPIPPPEKLTNEPSLTDSILNQGFNESWMPGSFDEELFNTPNMVKVEENNHKQQEPLQQDDDVVMEPSVEAQIVALEQRAEKEEDVKRRVEIVVHENCVVREPYKRPASPILSGNCAAISSQSISSPANGSKLRRLLDPVASTSGTTAPPPRKRISLSLKKNNSQQSMQQQQQPEHDEMQWLDEFGSQRELMNNVYSLWCNLKKEDLHCQKEMRKISKSTSTLQVDINKEEEIIRAAENRLRQKREQLVNLEKEQEDLQRRYDSCKIKIQHFRKFK